MSHKRHLGLFALLIALTGALFLPRPASAQNCAARYTWGERTTEAFSIIYPEGIGEAEGFASSLEVLFDEQLAAEFADYGVIFGTSLPVPITLRIYPDAEIYYCLNPLAAQIDDDEYHTHLSSREIVLIADRMGTPETQWDADGINALRGEFAALYAEARSNGSAPPGLIAGVAGYAADPNEVFEYRFTAAGSPALPALTLQTVWEDPLTGSLPESRFLATSMVAYLVDVYGWNAFLDLLDELANAGGYRGALEAIYDNSAGDLNRHWQEVYYPVYVAGRWRANLFHSFDLAAFETLIAQGAYTAAADGLSEALPAIETLGSVEELVRAQDLLAQAELGQSATAKMEAARKALLEGDFESSLAFAEEAGAIYDQLGSTTREAELIAYTQWANQVVELRNGLDTYSGMGGLRALLERGNLVADAQQLAALGDQAGLEMATSILDDISAGIEWLQLAVMAFFMLLLLFFLGLRILKVFRLPPPESQL